ncbi:nucleotidyltransferase family protein [Sedimentisphaera salicampi]|uniref:Nucleotidyltransferase domain protein n=1 Tax=Sedimentisphaera salicampi TaxID=1941349 RepID=A0A1W6LKL3_9BACT|nr:nucleotidyltransferase domain-containing protein [Sedimentisphaera salicampi]ARN56309.1 Nucleotidyltransferase domain protein [Sedimentisphaera salicampi]
MLPLIENKSKELAQICSRHGVSRLEVFGSAAAGSFDEQNSDIDFLVEFDSSVCSGRFDNYFSLHEDLKNLFSKPIDLVEAGGLKNPYFISQLNNTRKVVYSA